MTRPLLAIIGACTALLGSAFGYLRGPRGWRPAFASAYLACVFTLTVLLGSGCADLRKPPETYRIDSTFTAAEQDAIRVAVALWSAEPDADWAPREVSRGGDLHVRAVDEETWAAEGEGGCEHDENGDISACVTGNTESGWWRARTIKLRVDVLRDWGADDERIFALNILHELGHVCAGHVATPGSIMNPRSNDAALDRAGGDRAHVDYLSVMAFRDGCL